MSCEVSSTRSCDRYSQYGTCCMDMKRGQHGSDSFICVALITIFVEKLAWIKCCPRSMSTYKMTSLFNASSMHPTNCTSERGYLSVSLRTVPAACSLIYKIIQSTCIIPSFNLEMIDLSFSDSGKPC